MEITIFINDSYYGSVENSYHLSKVFDELAIDYPTADYDTDVQGGCVYLNIPNFV